MGRRLSARVVPVSGYVKRWQCDTCHTVPVAMVPDPSGILRRRSVGKEATSGIMGIVPIAFDNMVLPDLCPLHHNVSDCWENS